jgi:hypothetical protein
VSPKAAIQFLNIHSFPHIISHHILLYHIVYHVIYRIITCNKISCLIASYHIHIAPLCHLQDSSTDTIGWPLNNTATITSGTRTIQVNWYVWEQKLGRRTNDGVALAYRVNNFQIQLLLGQRTSNY